MRGAMRLVAILLFGAVLAGCTGETVRVGSKNFAENRVLAEMFAILLEEEGVRVERQTGLGPTPVVFQALKEGAIDLYPEYTGTGLALVGAPRIADPDAAFALVSESFAEHGMRFLDRLGFQTGYVVLTRPELARARGLGRVVDLAGADDDLVLGVSRTFAQGPRDGLEPFLDRFGLSFGRIEVVPDARRRALYDDLVEERVDVIVGFSTDPEIRDYRLATLEDTEAFFPAYDAAPLVSAAVLERTPAIGEALSALAGKLDGATMREASAAVALDGRPPRIVARRTLHDLGLVAEPPRDRVPVLALATEPATIGSEAASRTLRAVRRAMRGRDVDLLEAAAPVEAVAERTARLGLAPAIAGFQVDGATAVRDERFEAVAAVGSTFVHAIARADDPVRPGEARTIAAGPEGSASHALARAMAAAREDPADVVALEVGDGLDAAQAVLSGTADVAIVIAQPGRPDVREAFATTDGLALVDADGWWRGTARLALPFLREARIGPDVYAGLERPVSTLAMQLVLFGPARPERFVIGRQGPSTFSDELLPVTDQTVLAINENLGRHPAVDPHLRSAAALTPDIALRDERINPYPDRAVLTIAILAFFGWAGWLLVRPERRRG